MTYTRDVGLFVSKRGERYSNSSKRISRKGPNRAGRRPWDLINAAHRGFDLTPKALQEAVLGGLEVGGGTLWGACTIPWGNGCDVLGSFVGRGVKKTPMSNLRWNYELTSIELAPHSSVFNRRPSAKSDGHQDPPPPSIKPLSNEFASGESGVTLRPTT